LYDGEKIMTQSEMEARPSVQARRVRIMARPALQLLVLALFAALAFAGMSAVWGAAPDAGPAGVLAAAARTPVPDSLYPYPEQRVGFAAFLSEVDFSALHAGFVKLQDRGPSALERSLGPDFCTVIREDTEHWELPDPATYWAKIERLVAENPGYLWFIGNEPDNPCRFGTFSGEYAERYHKLYDFIKERDPTAQVGIGGVVLPSQIRRTWLERVLAAYQSRYGEAMPIDVWNVHNLLLSECPGECGCPPGEEGDDMPCEPLCCSGGYVPRELWCQKGLYFSYADQANAAAFKQLIVEFRQWMKDKGFQDKPLILTELGVLAKSVEGSCPNCFPRERVNQYMFDVFDFMMTEKDPQTGYPADGYRLVQRWTWYSLEDSSFNGNLMNQEFQLTDFGLNFANYTARFLPVSPTTIFFQRGWTGYREDCDTTLRPSESTPRSDRLWVAADGNQKGLLQFDLSILPTDVEVMSASLRLRSSLCSDPGGVTVNAYGIKRPWVVSEATWTNATTGIPWEMPGCGGANDREMAPTASVRVTTGDAFYTLDVTALASRWVSDPSTNHGLLLEASSTGAGYCTFISSDQAEEPPYAKHQLRPKLELVVRLPGPSPTASPTSTDVPTSTPTPTVTSTFVPTPTGSAYRVYLPLIVKSR
jgi:hypothetical protein